MVVLGLVILKPLTQWPGLHGTCYFHARANPSAGMFPFAQSMMCNLNNYCYNQSQHEDIPTFPGSRWVFLKCSHINMLCRKWVISRCLAAAIPDSAWLWVVIKNQNNLHGKMFKSVENSLNVLIFTWSKYLPDIKNPVDLGREPHIGTRFVHRHFELCIGLFWKYITE